MMRRAILLLLVVIVVSSISTATVFANPPSSTPATTDTVIPGNACNTPANGNTTGFANPPGVPTGVSGGGTPPTCKTDAHE